ISSDAPVAKAASSAPSRMRCGLPSASARSPRAVGSAPIRLTTTTLREPAAQAGIGDLRDDPLGTQVCHRPFQAGVAAVLAIRRQAVGIDAADVGEQALL